MTEETRPTPAIERATSAIGNLDGHPMLLAEEIDRSDVREVAFAALAAALDMDEMARAAHSDDLVHGRAAVAWEDMDAGAIDWYMSNARSIRAAIIGSGQ